MDTTKYTYDIFVIGGGSGGLSAAKEAAQLGKKVGLADFVKPSPQGSKWGLGGTCVNVGCIPKKMMHFAATLYNNMKYYPLVGYPQQIEHKFNWETLVENVQMHIYSLNYGYRTQLRSKKVTYYNKLAKIVSPHTIELTDSKGKTETVTTDKIVIAVGGRPNYPNLPGAKEHCITSDDIFSLKKAPGKTLIIGASYIALETAGFLREIGYDVTVMVRSVLLRGFDSDMAKRIGENLERLGVVFKYKCTPVSFTKQGETIICEYENTETKKKEKGTYDTVLLAVGRVPDTTKLLGEKVKLKLAQSGKIAVDASEKSSIDNIYSIGDCAEGRPELTPPAIMAGKLLARRLFAKQSTLMDYVNIPTTVFTPIEYGSCGLSEEAAKKQYGNNVVVYHKEFKPLEWEFDKNIEEACYMKIIVNKADKNKVIGFHIFSPNAGEVTQGIGVAMKIGVTKDQLDSAVGIHPTIAEEMTTMDTTKEMGDGKKSGC